MGIDAATLDQLIALSATGFRPAATLTLGRQGLYLREGDEAKLANSIKRHGVDLQTSDIFGHGKWSDHIWGKLGFGEVHAMDLSDYEGAEVIHDLNHPIPKDLHNQYDFIFDGGTIEHIFNTPVALANMYDLLKPNGVFVSINGHNGWPGHGLYQFGPDLVWSFWKRSCQCEVLSCKALPKDMSLPAIDLEDRPVFGVNGAIPAGRVSLYYSIRKSATSRPPEFVQQSQYEVMWDKGDATPSKPLNEGL